MVSIEEQIRSALLRALGQSSRWTVTVERGASGFVVRTLHPASHGVVLETGTFDENATLASAIQLIQDREFAVADAAPELEHADIALGLRTLTTAFDWPTVQVRAVAYLLFEAGGLSSDEAGWLAGYAANDAPMRATPPT